MNSAEKKLFQKIINYQPELVEITPGLQIVAFQRGRRFIDIEVGETYPYYDLASLTKILFSATVWMRWVSLSKMDLQMPIHFFLPWWRNPKTTVFQLMTHTAGLTWWKPFYKELHGRMEPSLRWRQLERLLAKTRPKAKANENAIYSDIDLYVLGFLMEALLQKDLYTLWLEVQDGIGLDHTQFHPRNRPVYARRNYAPTERCSWRKKTLQGEVHDENAWALGGVAPHAGLFGSLSDVSSWALQLRRAYLGSDKTYFGRSDVVREFVGRRLPRTRGDWGLCFMKPSKGRASCGRHFSLDSFGHTGFTGTSLWIDPVKDLIVVILSNRVHPTRENRKFVELRPRLHDWICELL